MTSDAVTRSSGHSPRVRARPRRASLTERVYGLYRHRRILGLLIIRDLKTKYSAAVLGYLWTILDPLVFSIVFWFVFTQIFTRGSPAEQPYIVWLLTGMIPFNWTRAMISGASRIMTGDSKLIVAAGLPRELWVLKTVVSEFVDFLFALPVIGGFVLFADRFSCPHAASCPAFDPTPNVIWLLVPVAMLIQFAYNLGLGLAFSPLGTLYPDVDRLLKLAAQTYRFVTPVIYSILLVPVIWHGLPLRKLYSLNPLVGILGVYHGMFFTPGATKDSISMHFLLTALGIAGVVSALCFVVGWWLFIRLEPEVLKELG